jgi:hypothetical protein
MRFNLKSIVVLTILLLLSNIAFAKDLIITIDGVEYVREYPTNLEEYDQVLNTVLDLNRVLNTTLDKYEKADDETRKQLVEEIDALQSELASLNSSLDTAKKEFAAVEKGVNKLLKLNTKFTLFFGAGLFVDPNDPIAIGTTVSILGEYRIWRNLHFGLSVAGNIYSNSNGRLFTPSISAIVGYSIF